MTNHEYPKRVWLLSTTGLNNRRNLFDITPGSEHQIATIVSGSSQNQNRFNKSLELIAAAPKMHSQLQDMHKKLSDLSFLSAPQIHKMKSDIQRLLQEIG